MRKPGSLFVVATPIGNLKDISLRSLEILKDVTLIVCEDTRVSKVLLSTYDIKKELIPLNEFNEESVVHKVLDRLIDTDVALISDAGTPLISDPGYRLVAQARKNGIKVVPIPGASAIIAALSASGLPTDKFSFIGFLPKSAGRAKTILTSYKSIETTMVLYESPHRIVKTLGLMQEVFGDIQATIAREMTKIHEEINSMKISEWITKYQAQAPKGEITLLFSTKEKS